MGIHLSKPGLWKLVVIDDDEFITDIIKVSYENDSAWTVIKHHTATAALECIRTSLPDAIITDLCLPDMDGMELLKLLKAEKKTWGIPIIVLSGYNDTEIKNEVYRAGAADYFVKPFVPLKLKERLTELMAENC